MDYEEEIAYNYLKEEISSNVIYEPDGNVPPDFVIDSKIAVEVRRLNQHHFISGKLKPNEELGYKLVPRIARLLKEFETEGFERSILVSIYFKRPLKVDSNLISLVKSIIKSNVINLKQELNFKIHDNFHLKLYPSSKKLKKSIFIGTISDYDSGGFIVSEILKNLEIVIPEKEEKIKYYYENYSQWWLILIDYIGYCLETMDIEQLNKSLNINTIFDKILLISPINREYTIDLKINNASA